MKAPPVSDRAIFATGIPNSREMQYRISGRNSLMTTLCILIADDEQPARFGMRRALSQSGHLLIEAEDGIQALDLIRSHKPDLVFLDLNMPRLDGKSLLRELSGMARETEIIVVTANNRLSDAVECIQLGAADFVAKPFEVEQLRSIARRVARRVQLQQEVTELQSELKGRTGTGAIIGASRQMKVLEQQLQRLAQAPTNVLLRGESGTGKELVAREIHRLSPQSNGPFIAVNTAAIPESLTESELFGHRKGAFTGAESDRIGVFQQATGGTLFLDEVGDMPLPVQAKILRALQERVIQPVGTSLTIPVDVRVISATHRNLEEAISSGTFRQDLYFRLKGIEIHLPPLRSRREDLLLLANHFLERNAQQMQVSLPEFTSDAVDAILSHQWPGNVRELENTVLAAMAMREGEAITSRDLGLTRSSSAGMDDQFADYLDLPLTEAKNQLVADFERLAINKALDKFQGNVSAAARHLGVHRQSLQQKMSQLDINR
ncbi:sigma-54-dependent transcriptional regulator [Planctomicrobium sp. SH527]|uniref:sigma-54-dependent transcriptional regulator n=1 Tax=Planctomicrobium sp. SH527 TaxID=3448123 RepID=UPI003F5AF792